MSSSSREVKESKDTHESKVLIQTLSVPSWESVDEQTKILLEQNNAPTLGIFKRTSLEDALPEAKSDAQLFWRLRESSVPGCVAVDYSYLTDSSDATPEVVQGSHRFQLTSNGWEKVNFVDEKPVPVKGNPIELTLENAPGNIEKLVNMLKNPWYDIVSSQYNKYGPTQKIRIMPEASQESINSLFNEKNAFIEKVFGKDMLEVVKDFTSLPDAPGGPSFAKELKYSGKLFLDSKDVKQTSSLPEKLKIINIFYDMFGSKSMVEEKNRELRLYYVTPRIVDNKDGLIKFRIKDESTAAKLLGQLFAELNQVFTNLNADALLESIKLEGSDKYGDIFISFNPDLAMQAILFNKPRKTP